jgi:hypothetical protein
MVNTSSEQLFNPQEFNVKVTSTNAAVKEIEAYDQPNLAHSPSATDSAVSSVGMMSIAKLKEKICIATIPDTVPEIGGTDICLELEAKFGLTEVSVSGDICFDNFCLTLLGAGITYSDAEICGDIRGKLKGIPLEVEFCLKFAPSINPVGLTIGVELTACLDLPKKAEEIYEKKGWEWTRNMLCIGVDRKVVL